MRSVAPFLPPPKRGGGALGGDALRELFHCDLLPHQDGAGKPNVLGVFFCPLVQFSFTIKCHNVKILVG